jgi:hypothetical protein
MASWAVAVRSPADLGYDDRAFRLPALTIHDEILPLTAPVGDALFPEMGMKGLSGRLAARRTALDDRVARLQRLTDRDGQWLLWCGLNTEADALTGAIDGAVNVAGSDSYSEKVGAVQAFVRGDIRCWRYGQRAPVSVHIVVSEAEGQVVANVRRKEAAAATLADRLLTHMQGFEREEVGVA